MVKKTWKKWCKMTTWLSKLVSSVNECLIWKTDSQHIFQGHFLINYFHYQYQDDCYKTFFLSLNKFILKLWRMGWRANRSFQLSMCRTVQIYSTQEEFSCYNDGYFIVVIPNLTLSKNYQTFGGTQTTKDIPLQC